MEPIRIDSTVPAEKLHHIIEEFSLNKKIDINYEDYNNRYIYYFILNKNKSDNELEIYNSIAEFVKKVVLKYYSRQFIRRRVYKIKEYKGLNKEKLVDTVQNMIADNKELITEKNNMKEEILDYMIENNTIIIDGYLFFRSSSFNCIIENALKKAMKETQLEMEYDEFIYALKHYINSEPSQIEGVNVFINENHFEITDLSNIPINNDFIIDTLRGLFGEDINQGDILLSTLLAIIPKRVKVHIEKGKENKVLDILTKIFEDKLTICYGCKLCYGKINENNVDKS